MYLSVIRFFSWLDLRGVIGSVIKEEAKSTFLDSGYWDEAFLRLLKVGISPPSIFKVVNDVSKSS